jgi:putative sterol carrier protein
MSLEQATQKIEDKIKYATQLRAKVLFDFEEDGVIFVDNTTNPAVISHARPDEVDCTLVTNLPTFLAILNGEKDPNMAFMMGQLKIRGSMGIALRLNSILEA